jgi:hypothetical protein
MPYNGSGTYSLPAGNPVVTGTAISSTTTNNTNSDIATALTNCMTRDGQSPPTENIPMGGNKLTGLASGTASGDALQYDQISELTNFMTAAATGDETGAGALVFAESPSLVTPVLDTPASGNLTNCTVDGTNTIGYRKIPQSGSEKTTAYTLATTDVGKLIGIGSSGSIVVPNSTFANGDAVSLFNNTAGNVTITLNTTTAYLSGTATAKASVALLARGVATVLFYSGTVCVVSGSVV